MKIKTLKILYIFVGVILPFIVNPINELLYNYDKLHFSRFGLIFTLSVCFLIGAYLSIIIKFFVPSKPKRRKINFPILIIALIFLILTIVGNNGYIISLLQFKDVYYIWSTISGFLLGLSFIF